MRILQIANKVPYPPKDGGAIATINLSLGLAEQGNEVTLLAMNTSKHYYELKDIPASIAGKIRIIDHPLNTDLNFWNGLKNLLFSRYPYNAERFFDEGFGSQLCRLLSEKDYDLVQLEGLYLGYYIPLIRKHSKAKIAMRAHNVEHEIWERTAEQEKSFWKKYYFKLLAKRIKNFKLEILNSYDFLIPITHRDSITFNELGNDKPVHVVPAGYNTSDLKARPDLIDFPSLGFIGTLDWFPNQEALIWFVDHVWKSIRKKYPELVFRVAGRNSPQWLSQYLSQQGNIDFLGEIEDAHAFINQTAIMVVPLFSGSGMRVKIIEGMALGKTIITTSIGAEGIPVTHGENIFIEDQADGFSKVIESLLHDRNTFEVVGQNALNFVKDNFDNKTICAVLADFYKSRL